MTDRISEVLDRLEAQQQREDDGSQLWPRDRDLMDMAEAVARGEYKPTPQQERALKLVMEYKYPKLAVTAISSMNGHDFAARLDRAVARAEAPPLKLIEHRPDETAPSVRWSGPVRGDDHG
jgi:hypothetical protein